jgi:hypothetical protein
MKTLKIIIAFLIIFILLGCSKAEPIQFSVISIEIGTAELTWSLNSVNIPVYVYQVNDKTNLDDKTLLTNQPILSPGAVCNLISDKEYGFYVKDQGGRSSQVKWVTIR